MFNFCALSKCSFQAPNRCQLHREPKLKNGTLDEHLKVTLFLSGVISQLTYLHHSSHYRQYSQGDEELKPPLVSCP